MQPKVDLAHRVDVHTHIRSDGFRRVGTVERESPFDLGDISLQQHPQGPANLP
ncbi:MAG: hypothetical protein WB646_01535 [Steroidobacteraceae bacterium]